MFDLAKFDDYREDNRREVKSARNGLPVSLWDTYSAFANCYGGVIILGVKEKPDGSWYTTGLKDPAKLQKDFWDTINNHTKISINLLSDHHIEVFQKDDDIIMVIHVPAARREQKPVFINDDLFGGTFRRNWEGDYHCTREEVKAMLRDQAEDNPGSIRTGKDQILKGGISDPRNKALMKMFNMIGIGERAGSGVPCILQTWSTQGWASPQVEEQYGQIGLS